MLYQLKSTSFLLVLMSLFLFSGAKKAFAKKTKKQNVLLVFTDDHRYTGVHALGQQQVKTPNMDALADNGIAFTNAYLMGSFSGATCIPSRAMLHTGRQLFHLQGQGHVIPKDQTTIGEQFHEAGYNTQMVGKWHQDNKSLVRSFDSGSTVMGRGLYLTDHFRMPLWDWDQEAKFSKQDAYLLVYDEDGNTVRRALTKKDKRGPTGTEEDGPHTSEIFADKAIEYIDNYKEKDPFFMYLAFHAPHDPRQAPQKYLNMYPADSIQLPPSYMAQHPFDNGHMVLRDEALAPWPRTPEVARQHLAEYYAIITHLDAQIGRVIAALKESGQYENTLIVFAGDSGLAVGCHGLIGKQSVYDEDGVHVPFIISGANVAEKGKRIDALTYTYDIFPTICDLSGVSIPESVDGKSLAPVIKGEKKQVRDYTYHAYRQHQRAYRKGDYKLVEFVRATDYDRKSKSEIVTGSRVTLLFNTKNDPWETTNLAFLPDYKEVLNKMKAEMKQKAVELGYYKEHIDYQYDFWDFY